MSRLVLCLPLALLPIAPARAAPYVAYIGNVPVHSPSPDAKVVVADLATGAAVDVSEGLQAARSPAWAPGADRAAFEAIEDGLNDIFVCAPDGSGRANVTNTPDRWESSPAFIDEDTIVYLEGPDRTHLWRLDVISGAKQRLTEREAFHGTPVASADRSVIAITASEKLGGPGDILLVSADGAGVHNLTGAPALYSTPCFTPDATQVAFCFDGWDIGGATRGLAIVALAGGEPTLLADDGYPLGALSMSPDGTRIAYTSASTYHSTWVSLVGVDRSDKRRLEVGPFHIAGWPSFSPDGTHLAYQGVYAAKYTVHVVDLETGEDMALGEGATGVNPVFSPR